MEENPHSSRSFGDSPLNAMDRAVARPLHRRRRLIAVVAACLMAAAGAGILVNRSGSVYRVPFDRLTIATAKLGVFEDFIPVRATVAPYVTAYLTTDQGGTVRQVLVEDGATAG